MKAYQDIKEATGGILQQDIRPSSLVPEGKAGKQLKQTASQVVSSLVLS